MKKEDLPKKIPVFPLNGVIYFPKTNLPLNIFEERYLDLVKDILENDKILKIGHFLRFDKNALEYFLKCKVKNIFDTKIASKIVRTYTDAHGLKNLVQEFCNKSIDKRQGSSDWNKDINELSEKQLEYAANDVIYLHKIHENLEKILKRENRIKLYKDCLKNYLKVAFL